MTEEEWLAATDPPGVGYSFGPHHAALCRFVLDGIRGQATARKLRLFLCAFWRWIGEDWDTDWNRRIVPMMELCADGWVTEAELQEFLDSYDPTTRRVGADIQTAGGDPRGDVIRAMDLSCNCQFLLRDIFGNPFRSKCLDPFWLAWRDKTIPRLAEAIYDRSHKDFLGRLNSERLAVLADALEDAGCNDHDILGHLRGGGHHVRGCWAVDLVLGKE